NTCWWDLHTKTCFSVIVPFYFLSLILVGTFLCPDWLKGGIAIAGQKVDVTAPQEESGNVVAGEAGEYHTPLAGEPFKTIFMRGGGTVYLTNKSSVSAILLTWPVLHEL
ncbi:MAG TPA: hypothetical protein PL053_12060, partial [Deltaproteobacteria bacterium]|nr:hypothetical protein [Deltaproteobacteria bacterium]